MGSLVLPSAGKGRILDFDIENRPLSYWVQDRPTAEITAIASMWVGDHDSMQVDLLQPEDDGPGYLLARFVERYNQADMVTGHYIRRHDLPIINAGLYELGMPLLESKLTCDTKLDMFKKADLPANQEYLLELLQPECPLGWKPYKEHMTQADWREANRLTAKGLQRTHDRVSSDVHAHMHMRDAMLAKGMLRAPSVWNPGGAEVVEGRHR